MQMDADILKSEFNRGTALQSVLLRYVQGVYTQIAQGSACNPLHKLEGWLARWLLTVYNRLASDKFPLTQEIISQMLGVRGAGVIGYFERRTTSGTVEGINNKLKLIKRLGYGFRNL